MANRKRGSIAIFNCKKGISHDLFFNVFELVLAFVVVLALFNFVADVVEQTIFEKNYLARDLALFVNILYAAPGKVVYTYEEDARDFILNFTENRIAVYDAGQDGDEVNTFYLFAENKNRQFEPNDHLNRDKVDRKLYFFKLHNKVGVDIEEPAGFKGTFGFISTTPPVASGKAFFIRLKDSGYFGGFTDAFLWGLIANAQHESGFIVDAAGDSRDSTAGGNANAIEVGGLPYCSFGYWQLNICAGDGIGFARFNNYEVNNIDGEDYINVDDKGAILADITNEAKQFEYIAYIMKTRSDLFPNEYDNESLTAEYFGEQIAIRFERCSECAEFDTQTLSRGELAYQYQQEAEDENTFI